MTHSGRVRCPSAGRFCFRIPAGLFAAAVAILFGAACSASDTTATPSGLIPRVGIPDSIELTLSRSVDGLMEGDTITVTAIVRDALRNRVTNSGVQWRVRYYVDPVVVDDFETNEPHAAHVMLVAPGVTVTAFIGSLGSSVGLLVLPPRGLSANHDIRMPGHALPEMRNGGRDLSATGSQK